MVIKNKKRGLSFFLCIVMTAVFCLPIFSAVTSYADGNDEYNVSISPAFGGWENWVGSPNNPSPGEQPGVTQLLVGISGENGEFPAALDTTELVYTLTFDWIEGNENKTKTINLKPATVASVYKLVRFETVLAEGDNQFIPYKNQAYTLTLEVTTADGTVYRGKSGEYSFSVPMYPVVNGVVDESYIYQKPSARYPYTVKISEYHSGNEEIGGVSYFKSDWEVWNGRQMLILLVDKKDIYDTGDFSSGTIVGLSFNGGEIYRVALDSTVDMGSSLLIRLPTESVFIPEDGVVYTVDMTVYKTVDGSEIVAYSGRGENFTAGGVRVSPQTGDGAVLYIGLAVISVMLMSYILMPKSRKAKELSSY